MNIQAIFANKEGDILKTVMELQKRFFGEKERVFISSNSLSASGFVYESGVFALRVKNSRGEFIILPYHGQQIWRAAFDGHELTMRSMFDEPRATDVFGGSYGAFMLHCGFTAMGNPSPEDNHPQHGEMPRMPYDKAYIAVGSDEKGSYIEVGGSADYKAAFTTGYTAKPQVRLYENETLLHISMTVTNNRHEPLSYAYLCHVNFRPIEGARIVDNSKSIYMHKDIPEDFPKEKEAKLREYFGRLESDISIMETVDSSSQYYEPEIVFTMKFNADENGLAHCMQIAPEGYSNYVCFDTGTLPMGLRWIARNKTEDAMGFILPSTAEHKGLKYCMENNLMRQLPGLESITFNITAGYLDKENTEKTRRKIK